MAKAKSSVGFWVLISTLLIGGGIGAYFLLRKPKEETDEETDEEEVVTDVSSSGGGGGGASTSSTNAPVELNSTEKIKEFQNYVLTTKKDTTILGKSGADGIYGKNSQNAWNKYGKDFIASKVTPTKQSNVSQVEINKNIDIIVKNSTGKKSDKTYLSKVSSEFVDKWATAITNKKRAFIWANQIYRTKTGDRVLDYNPINRTHYIKKTGNIAYPNANAKEGSLVNKDSNIGKVTGFDFNSGIYLFVGGRDGNKWFKASDVTTKKPASSVEGGNNNIEFSSFDNNFDLNL